MRSELRMREREVVGCCRFTVSCILDYLLYSYFSSFL